MDATTRARPSGPVRRRHLAVLAVSFLALALLHAAAPASAEQAAAIGFGKSTLQGADPKDRATSVQFGPDGRLYVLHQDGTVFIYGIARTGPNDYDVTSKTSTALVRFIDNHDDDGRVNNSFSGPVIRSCTAPCRMATGMLVAGTAAAPVIYVASSDPRFGNPTTGDTNLDTNSGVVSRLTWNPGPGTWSKVDLVRGLPRSEENHATNGLALDASTNTLYLAVGGHTNQGAPGRVFNHLPEYALSAAILSIDLGAIGSTTYDVPTLDDPTRANTPSGADVRDPFGGNDGLNQARIVPGGPVQVHSPGYRNPYDLLIATAGSHAGKMYVTDNGYNAGQGGPPGSEGPGGTCTNVVNDTSPKTGWDSLHHVTGPGYYGGHPNPTRGNNANLFGGQTPVPVDNPVECDFQRSAGDEPRQRTAIASDPSSTNGIAEYTASNFGGAMRGDLIAAEWDGYVNRYQLDAAGTAVTQTSRLFSDVSVHPLDITATGDDGPFPGTIWLADHVSGTIFVFEPNDYSGGGTTCTGADDPALEEDGDGYTNADEIDNGTNPCSAGDVPPDWDNDRVSNLRDPDDDDDGRPDTSDPWAIDASDGTSTSLPVEHPYDDTDASAGGLLNLGFTGLMSSGTDDYEALYDPTKLSAGGNGGVLTVDAVGPGTATGSANSQEYAFQYGFSLASARGAVFTPHTRVLTPFAGVTPTGTERIGMHLGTGDQDNFVRLAVTGAGSTRSVVLEREFGGVFTPVASTDVSLPSSGYVDLFLAVDPTTRTVRPSYQITVGTTTGPRTDLGTPSELPADWFTRPALAAGVIATSGGAPSFPATWDLFEVQSEVSTYRPDARARLSSVSALTGNDVYGTTGVGQTVRTTAGRGVQRTFVVNVQNDGTDTDAFLLRGPGSSTGFTVQYFAGTTNITTAVVNGTYRQNNVPVGGTRAIQMRVRPGSAAAIGAARSSLVTATSANSGTIADAVRTVVTVR